MSQKDRWDVVEGVQNYCPLIIRIRNDVTESYKATHPHKISIIWNLKTPMKSGLPSKEEFKLLEEFEDDVWDAYETDGHSVISLIYTNNGMREWVFYTHDIDDFGNRFNRLPQKEERYPIELYFEKDENWNLYEKVKRDLNNEG